MNIQVPPAIPVRDAFMHPDMFGTSLLLLLVDQYGVEAVNWEFETIRQELADDFKVVLSPVNEEKLQAVLTILTSDGLVTDPVIFSRIAEALGSEPVNHDMNVPLDPDLAAWALFEASLLEPSQMAQMSDQVKRFLGACLTYAGVHGKPKTLSQAILPDEEEDADGISADVDPDALSAYMRRSTEDATGIDLFVKNRAKALFVQIHRLPLQHRDAKGWPATFKRLMTAVA